MDALLCYSAFIAAETEEMRTFIPRKRWGSLYDQRGADLWITRELYSLIVVTDIKGMGMHFFTGTVPAGGEFHVTNPEAGELIGSNVHITIYKRKTARQNIRQTILIHTSLLTSYFLEESLRSSKCWPFLLKTSALVLLLCT